MVNHKELQVWQLSMDFVVELYKLTDSFPESEKFGLVSQLRRAAVSVPSNVAEGAARKGNKENIQFLYIALGSISEIETQLILADRLKFISEDNTLLSDLITIKSKMINYIKYLKTLKPLIP
jgi:four helix bundle protein